MHKFSNDKPIYAQIVDLLHIRIITGAYPAKSKLPSVRDLAMELGVNPNTMQRAFAQLEQEGYVWSERTAGRFVTDDEGRLQAARANLMESKTTDYVSAMKNYKASDQEMLDIVASCAARYTALHSEQSKDRPVTETGE